MKKFLLMAVMMLTFSFVNAQKNKEYRSFNEAYLIPDSVYCLNICNNFNTNQNDLDKLYLLKKLVSLKLCIGVRDKVQLPESICQLSNLEVLELPYLPISSLPKDFVKLKNLKVLKLNMNGFESKTDKFLFLMKNKKTNEYKEFGNDAMYSNDAFSIHSEYDQISSGKESFGLGYQEIFELVSLEELTLRDIPFIKITADLSKLINLKKLIIERGNLESIPNSVFKLKNLEELSFYDDVNKMPDEISQLQNLKTLKLNGVYILSNEINKLFQLKHLELGGETGNIVTQINNLPKTIEYLSISGFPLKNIQFISNLKNLKKLSLDSKYRLNGANSDDKSNLISFPNELLLLRSLESLYLTGDFDSMPENFGVNLSNIKSLEISAPLLTLPKSIESMGRLERLILYDHKLNTLPIDFDKVPSLNGIDLQGYDNPNLKLTPKQKKFIESHGIMYGG